jgi:hypothetical protein
VTTPPPPAELAWLTDLVGPAPLLRLIEAHGGTRLYIPKDPNQGMPIARLLGLDQARALAQRCGGDFLKVPLARNWRVRLYRARGDSYPAIARALGITESQVSKILTAAGATRAQMDLFAP